MTRELIAEGMGSAGLLYIVVGSGIAAETLGSDPGLQLLAHGISVGFGLAVLIALVQTVSGSHFNPSVTVAFWRTGVQSGSEASGYVIAQFLGALVGVALANLTFGERMIAVSQTARFGVGLLAAEAIATFVLVLVILALVRTGRPEAIPAAVGGWVAAVMFATSSTGFANPVVTLARMLTDSYTGIAPSSAVGFVAAQLIAGFAAAPVATLLYPETAPEKAPA